MKRLIEEKLLRWKNSDGRIAQMYGRCEQRPIDMDICGG